MCDPDETDYEGNVLRHEEVCGHTYTITRAERELGYRFMLYINGKLHTTDRELDHDWTPENPWLPTLERHAEKQIEFLNEHI